MPRARSAAAAIATSPRSFAATALPSMSWPITRCSPRPWLPTAAASSSTAAARRTAARRLPLDEPPLLPPPTAAARLRDGARPMLPPRASRRRRGCVALASLGSPLSSRLRLARLRLRLARRVEVLVPTAALQLERGARDEPLERSLPHASQSVLSGSPSAAGTRTRGRRLCTGTRRPAFRYS